MDYPTTPAATEEMKEIGEFTRIMTDFPRAWSVCREATTKDQHHENCSWRTASMLCDCAASKTFTYCIDKFITPYQDSIRSLQSRLRTLETEARAGRELRETLEPFTKPIFVIIEGGKQEDLFLPVRNMLAAYDAALPTPQL